MKRNKNMIGIVILISILAGACSLIYIKTTDDIAPLSSPISYKNLRPNLSFKEIYPEPEFKNLSLSISPGKLGIKGEDAKIIRAYRFKNITDAVEERYGLPQYTILAMVIIESSGIDLLPNSLGDGGFGLCHMQPSTAQEFGLKIYKNCHAMVCDGKDRRSCKDKKGRKLNHAKDLADLIKSKNYDKRLLIEYDDRLHPVLNIDAAGRMIASYMNGPKIKKLSPIKTAICRYAGKYNFKSYWKKVQYYTGLLKDESFITGVEKRFNESNPNLEINSEKGDFTSYIKTSQEQNLNYGLEEYQELPKYNQQLAANDKLKR